MNCPKCNAALQQGAAFCAACGLNLAQGLAPPPQGFPPPQYPPPPQGFPPPPHYPPGYAPPHPPMGAPRSSGMAIAGFVLSFFCGLLGLIFSIIGYNECKKSNGMLTGEGLALAGIIISIASMLIGLMMIGSGSRF